MMYAATYAIGRLLQIPGAYRRWKGRGFRRGDALVLTMKYFDL